MRHIYTVTEINDAARTMLEQSLGLVWIEAELSGIARPASGHLYFSLKDPSAQIRCAFFRQRNSLLNFRLADGMKVLVRGRISLYEPRGDYQLIVEHMEPAGEGDLHRAYELLKQTLQAQGLFNQSLKKAIPGMPQCIGVITSPAGAAIRDILHILKRRYPVAQIIIYPSAVQGRDAAENLCRMVELADRRQECDVLIISRGGGSLEDLWAFNDEVLARGIHLCTLPVISGIGHEIDFTIADFVADLRAPTPSAAAEQATPDGAEVLVRLQNQARRLYKMMDNTLQQYFQSLDRQERRLTKLHPGQQLKQKYQLLNTLLMRAGRSLGLALPTSRRQLRQLGIRFEQQSPIHDVYRKSEQSDLLKRRLLKGLEYRLDMYKARLAAGIGSIHALSPMATLSRGYTLTFDRQSGKLLTGSQQTSPGKIMETRLSKGRIISRVESV